MQSLFLHLFICHTCNQERDQRYKELGFRDRITLSSGRFLLGNKYASVLFQIYSCVFASSFLHDVLICLVFYLIMEQFFIYFLQYIGTFFQMIMFMGLNIVSTFICVWNFLSVLLFHVFLKINKLRGYNIMFCRYARTFAFFYTIGLHILVFTCLYRMSALSYLR